MKIEQFISIVDSGSISIPGILFEHYADLGLSETEIMILLKIKSQLEKGSYFPTPDELANNMSIASESCMNSIRLLIKRGFLDIEEFDQSGILHERYSLYPLWNKLYKYFLQKDQPAKEKEETEKSLYTVFEQEFGRPLSPFECESLTIWLDQDYHDPVIIKTALREAVISGKLNFRYIDRILFEWKKNGVQTIEQARIHSRKFRQYQTKSSSSEGNESTDEYKRKVPFYNWLEN
ncbi:DnaD domain-containing protein [Metabacillus arenae]|uniref:DnaD domain-containing protein n=1 Tax=Metabacillus arenae TaxID=2771434 RepID=A0A926NKJ6_9BACI|nr:DnaD domain-containing protein [Metabacillus arenae]MBD1381668.1 DnaD domain-containing protein [Metabacillus arenae]